MSTFARTVTAAALLFATFASSSVLAQEAVDEPVAEEMVADDTAAVAPELAAVLEPALAESAPVADSAPPAIAIAATAPTPVAIAQPAATAAPAPAPAAAPAAASGARVNAAVVDNRFQPSALTVAVGTTVTWTNNGNNAHTLSSTDGLFDSGGLFGGQTFSYTFDKAGTYTIICRQHGLNGMAGQVVVQ